MNTISDLIAPQIHEKAVSEIRWAKVDFTGKLDDNETLSAIQTVDVDPDLSVVASEINTDFVRINGRDVPPGKAVLVKLSGGTAWCEYGVFIRALSTPAGQDLTGEILLKVRPDQQLPRKD